MQIKSPGGGGVWVNESLRIPERIFSSWNKSEIFSFWSDDISKHQSGRRHVSLALICIFLHSCIFAFDLSLIDSSSAIFLFVLFTRWNDATLPILHRHPSRSATALELHSNCTESRNFTVSSFIYYSSKWIEIIEINPILRGRSTTLPHRFNCSIDYANIGLICIRLN